MSRLGSGYDNLEGTLNQEWQGTVVFNSSGVAKILCKSNIH